MQVPRSSLMRLRGPLSPIPPVRQAWNLNSPLAPSLVASSPGTFIFFSPPTKDSEGSATMRH